MVVEVGHVIGTRICCMSIDFVDSIFEVTISNSTEASIFIETNVHGYSLTKANGNFYNDNGAIQALSLVREYQAFNRTT